MTLPKIYGVIGYPVKHSLSPRMHNAAFKALKINAEYKLFPLREKELGTFLKGLPKKGIFGLNVTVPYKEKVIPYLDKISPLARQAQAVNTIKVVKRKLLGFNTDGKGFLRHLRQDLRFNPRGKSVVVLGAGGGAKAVLLALAGCRPVSIAIYDIDQRKARKLTAYLKKSFRGLEIRQASSIDTLGIENADLLVNATPIGLKKSDPLIVSRQFLRRGMLVYDLIYNPAKTKLLKAALKKGSRVSNGLGMLLYQGAESFSIWTGRNAPLEVMRRALTKERKR
jgi:shikimate dehydrogenase